MPLQNFLPFSPPAVSAEWLNIVDRLKFIVFGDAVTKVAARQQWALDTVNLGIVTGTLPGAYVASLPFDGWTYSNGGMLSFTPDFTNAGAATLNIGGIGELPIVRPGGAALIPGDLPANTPVIAAFNTNADALVLISFTITSPIGVETAVLVAGTNHNVPVATNTAFLECNTAAGAATITGVLPQSNGALLTLTNVGPNPLTLDALSGAALPAARFRLSANVMLLTNDSFTFRYSSAIGLWVSIS